MKVLRGEKNSAPSPRLRAASAILPLMLFLLLSPTALRIIAQTERQISGLPIGVAYLFALWFAAIIVGVVIARGLRAAVAPNDRRDEA